MSIYNFPRMPSPRHAMKMRRIIAPCWLACTRGTSSDMVGLTPSVHTDPHNQAVATHEETSLYSPERIEPCILVSLGRCYQCGLVPKINSSAGLYHCRCRCYCSSCCRRRRHSHVVLRRRCLARIICVVLPSLIHSRSCSTSRRSLLLILLHHHSILGFIGRLHFGRPLFRQKVQ